MGKGKTVKEQEISNLSDLSTVNEKVYNEFYPQILLWWRGHADISWKLHPKVFRHPSTERKNERFRESNLATMFEGRAMARVENHPTKATDWLFLMQHYGLPTRLLDWTESSLIALYFVIRKKEHYDVDGALWGLSPALMNEALGQMRGILGVEDAPVRTLFNEIYEDKKGKGPPVDNENVLAINAPHANLRMMLQQSAFTIHGTIRGLYDFENINKYLVKYKVPKEAKPDLALELRRLGIVESYLFPELEYLAEDLINSPIMTEEIKD